MGLLDSIKEMFGSGTEPGIVYECAECGERFDEAHHTCPECGSTEILEREGFEMRPDG
jgi:rRNA maturation endonuclease Nob1